LAPVLDAEIAEFTRTLLTGSEPIPYEKICIALSNQFPERALLIRTAQLLHQFLQLDGAFKEDWHCAWYQLLPCRRTRGPAKAFAWKYTNIGRMKKAVILHLFREDWHGGWYQQLLDKPEVLPKHLPGNAPILAE
jgi:hypothetical protein